MNVLEVNNLNKSFNSQKVLDNLAFSVSKGSVFGFLGQNGAGKTTTMKIALGLLKADSGDVKIYGETVKYGNAATNKNVGYLPDVPEFYGYLRAREYLKLCGEVSGFEADKINERTREVLSQVGLDGINKKISGYSRGMKQRLGIAQALLCKPGLLICDEPTSALDPGGRKDILDILYGIKEETTVIFSTHILADVERICDSVAILHKGKIALDGNINDIKSKSAKDTIFIEFKSGDDLEKFINLPGITESAVISLQGSNTVILETGSIEETEQLVMDMLSKNRLIPKRLELGERNLENLFMEVTG